MVGDLPEPTPGPGEVCVAVAASAVNPSDVKRRTGFRGAMEFPRIVPHSDGAGVIAAAGEGVPAARVGERVWLYQAQWGRPFGTAAAMTVVPSALAVPLPQEVPLAEGACLGIPAMTAHRCVYADGPVQGHTVVVSGGGGRVGHYAVQMAKRGGARVLATAGSERSAKVAEAAGADEVIDYRGADVGDEIMELTDGAGADRVIEVELGANLPWITSVLKPNGVVAAYASMADPRPQLAFYPLMQRNATLRLVLVYDMPEAAKRAAIDDITRWLSAGLNQVVAARYPLERIAEAHDALDSGGMYGVVLITIDPTETS